MIQGSTKTKPACTDWNAYYQKPAPFSRFTRRITTHKLVNNIRRFTPSHTQLAVAELGAGNSCFYDTLRHTFPIKAYHLVDSSAFGFDVFKKIHPHQKGVYFHLQNLLEPDPPLPKNLDLVFSVGLIEHFREDKLPNIIQAHFQMLKPGGIVILSFPINTVTYRLLRFLAETTGQWMFHDEIPLEIPQILPVLRSYGTLLHYETIPIGFTQCMVILQKQSLSENLCFDDIS